MTRSNYQQTEEAVNFASAQKESDIKKDILIKEREKIESNNTSSRISNDSYFDSVLSKRSVSAEEYTRCQSSCSKSHENKYSEEAVSAANGCFARCQVNFDRGYAEADTKQIAKDKSINESYKKRL